MTCSANDLFGQSGEAPGRRLALGVSARRPSQPLDPANCTLRTNGSPVRSRLVVGSVYGAMTVAMVAGTTAFVGLDKNVSISVDGQVTHVRTYAGTVEYGACSAPVSLSARMTPSHRR